VGLGTHEALLRESPLYLQLWETQRLDESVPGHATPSRQGSPATVAGDGEEVADEDAASP
jgi:hypothetical protein